MGAENDDGIFIDGIRVLDAAVPEQPERGARVQRRENDVPQNRHAKRPNRKRGSIMGDVHRSVGERDRPYLHRILDCPLRANWTRNVVQYEVHRRQGKRIDHIPHPLRKRVPVVFDVVGLVA